MLFCPRFNAADIKNGIFTNFVWSAIGIALLATPPAVFGQAAVNQDCTLVVPHDPLTPTGLATPYQLMATNPANGPCHEADANQSAFVQAAIIDKDTGQIAVYGPLVIDRGATPAVAPVVPKLPARYIAALWFGFNANNLSLAGYGDDLRDSHCQQGMGQFAYCNAVAFFHEADEQIDAGKLVVPPLGISPKDHHICPSVRSFVHVDQDQSDNVTTVYLFTQNGRVAQNTAANRAKLGGSVARGNPSDNRLLDVFIDGALGCTPWTVSDLADPGARVPALPLNELQAAKYQKPPIARIPLGDPFVLRPPLTGVPSLSQVNRYRRGVYQQRADDDDDASTTTYCRNIRDIHTDKLIVDRPFLSAFRSVDPRVANNLYTFMAQRYAATYQILGCEALLNLPLNVNLLTNANGVVVDANVQ